MTMHGLIYISTTKYDDIDDLLIFSKKSSRPLQTSEDFYEVGQEKWIGLEQKEDGALQDQD